MKFLTDAQVNALVVKMLRDLGWHVETVYEHNLGAESADERLVARAREHGFVFLTFDKFRGMTGPRVRAELRERGGKAIRLHEHLPRRRGSPTSPRRGGCGRGHYCAWNRRNIQCLVQV